ncbi:hypothetical protein JCM10213v2_008259 [Rhodosporidiobolus nylandii]
MAPLPAIPAIPDIHVSPYTLHLFLPWSLEHTLVPFLPFPPGQIIDTCPPAVPGELPPWNRELEEWYQLFHPGTWDVLEDDKYHDNWVIFDLITLKNQHAAEAAAVGQEGAKWLELILKRLAVVQHRRSLRWLRFYALHGLRKIYLEEKHRLGGGNVNELLDRLPRVEDEEKPPGPPGSVPRYEADTSPPDYVQTVDAIVDPPLYAKATEENGGVAATGS